MMEKALTRNDPGRYEIIHVVGKLRAIPSTMAVGSGATGTVQPMASPAPTNGKTGFGIYKKFIYNTVGLYCFKQNLYRVQIVYIATVRVITLANDASILLMSEEYIYIYNETLEEFLYA